jgi:hypothetical protein
VRENSVSLPGRVHYRGHGTDEYLTVDKLHRIAELTVTALWRLTS